MNAPDILRLPPHSSEAEQSVIGSLLLDNAALDRIPELRPAHFYRDDHRRIFTAILGLAERGDVADVASVFDALERLNQTEQTGGFSYLVEVANSAASIAGIATHAKRIRSAAMERGLLAAVSDIAERVHGAGTAAEKVDFAQGKLMALAETVERREPKLAREILLAHLDKIQGRWERKSDGIEIGFPDLDAKLGGLKGGSLVIIAGRPAMGKTAFALNIAAHVGSALFLSQEMSEGELMDRLIAAEGRLSMERVIHGGMCDEDHDKMGVAVGRLDTMPLLIDDSPALTVADVRAKARAAKRKHGIELLVIDYLQLMSGMGDNRNSVIEEISRGLKGLAKELNIPVIALSQLSRKCEERTNRRPMLSDLRDSGAIEQDADIVLFVYRDEIYNPDSEAKGTAEILIAKNRQGAVGMARLVYVGEQTKFESYAGGPIDTRPQQPTKRRGFRGHGD